MTYYNERNGHVDNGKKLNNNRCPNCSSGKYTETISREYCPDCGLECDYWGSGANEVYEQWLERKYAADATAQEARYKKYYGEDDDY